MTSSIDTTFNYNHPLISIILAIYLCFLYFNMKNLNRMLSIVKILIIFNCFVFYGSLLYIDAFDFKIPPIAAAVRR